MILFIVNLMIENITMRPIFRCPFIILFILVILQSNKSLTASRISLGTSLNTGHEMLDLQQQFYPASEPVHRQNFQDYADADSPQSYGIGSTTTSISEASIDK